MRKKLIVILSILAVLIICATIIFASDYKDKIFKYINFNNTKQDADLKGGVYAVFEPVNLNETNLDNKLLSSAEKLQILLRNNGYSEASVTLHNNNQIRAKVPGEKNLNQLFENICCPALLELKSPEGNVFITNKDLENAYAIDNENGQYAIALKFNNGDKEKLAKETEKNLNKKIDILINSQRVMSPIINCVINDGKILISENYTFEEANELAVKLMAGSFDIPLKLIEADTYDPIKPE